jgi:hypothetical protein
MSKFLVVYTDQGDRHEGEIDARFRTRAEAEKFIKEQNEKEDPAEYDNTFGWTYEICEVVSSFVTTVSVSVKRDLKVKEVKP